MAQFVKCLMLDLSLRLDLGVVSARPMLGSMSNNLKKKKRRGTWVTQLVKCPTVAQIMIARSVDQSLMLGSVLTAQSLEPASDSVSPFLSDPQIGRAHV